MLDVVNAASHGDLTLDVIVSGPDAIGQMGEALDHFSTSCATVFMAFAENATTLSSASEELSAISTQMSANAEEETSSQSNVVAAAA